MTPKKRAAKKTAPAKGPPRVLVEKKAAENARRAHPGKCARCQAPLLLGLDDECCALSARADIEPVGLITELVAVLSGRRSYDLIAGDLHHRDSFRACLETRWTIHLEHRC